MKFEPIAIVGQGCVLPGGLTPDELWKTVHEGRDVLGSPPPDYWGVSAAHILREQKSADFFDHTWSDRGGYVRDFAGAFDPRGFLVDQRELRGLDPLYLWAVEAARQAIDSAGWRAGEVPGAAGVVLGNLSYPTKTMMVLAENVWRGSGHSNEHDIDWRNRFMSGLPAHFISNALGLTGGAAALDAACASSLYAIKLACDRLHDHAADVMLAGGVNGASDLLLHVGFSALQALSRTGKSRPFHQGADGLVPAEGAAVLVLRRLADAVADGNTILGVIRGVGLSNDGQGRGLLVPSQEGQERAMRRAYEMAELEPQDISLIECHATGTSRGDLTELMSMTRIFDGMAGVPIGSLKSNLGHSITASGAAGAIKVLAAMRAGVRPPTLHVDDPLPFLADSPFRLLTAAEPWDCNGPRRAAVNNFGFGGNNAHLLLEEWVEPTAGESAAPRWPVSAARADGDIAIVGLSLLVGDEETASVAEHLRTCEPIPTGEDDGVRRARMTEVALDVTQTRFPPSDLKQTLPQQLALLGAALNIDELIKGLPQDRTSVVVGMGCDTEVARLGARWRLADEIEDPDQLAAARDAVVQGWNAAGVVGAMPNIVANRLNRQFDLRGPSFTVSREQLSGTTALEVAARALRRNEIDAAVVGAVDLSCEPVHEAAARALLGSEEQTPGDAAVVLVLKRAEDARRDGDTVLATLPADQKTDGAALHLGTAPGALDLSPLLGHSHAASGLLYVAAGVLYGLLGVWPDGAVWNSDQRSVIVELNALAGQQQQVVLVPPAPQPYDAGVLSGRSEPAAQPEPGKATLLRFAGHLPKVQLPKQLVDVPSSVDRDNPPTTHELEQLMATHLPVPPPLPSVRESLARVPWGAALVAQTPPAPLSVANGHGGPVAAPQPETAAPQPEVAVPAVSNTLPQNGTDYLPGAGTFRAIQPVRPTDKKLPEPTVKREPTGLTLDKDGLRVHASGKISEIFGPAFAQQDDYARQVRMPEPPLLLADRLLGIDAEPGVNGTGTLWTETDVTPDAWWLHRGRMPAGIMIESGQADLMLISWMGADFANKGERVYRLLGCEVTYLGGLPEIGDTLRFDIHVDGHARQGDIRMFFFHYDCTINGVERMSMRNGQAGFFSDAELAESGGILWRPEDETVDGPMEPTPALTSRNSLQRNDLEAMAAGDIWQTFGAGFETAASHTRTPAIAGGDMLFVDEVTDLDFTGGPWGRGYLRAVSPVTAENCYFAGHFKNDPCMPGTLMFEATMQTMAIYMTALGMTLDCDGWRFEPVPFETYKLVCRGQVTPQSRELVYEVFVREVIAGPEPTLFADLLVTVDGLPAFHCRRMGLKLSPGWPMDMGVKELDGYVEPKAVSSAPGITFDYQAMLACASAKPSMAFGPQFERFDTHRKAARLPGPPYHFMSRVTELVGELGSMKSGAEVVVEYDVPGDAWYFAENGASGGLETMPNAVLMEVALQPCGWLASYVGCPLDNEIDLFFRNLDGTGTQHREVTPATGTLQIKVVLKSIAKAAGTIIVSFDGEITAADGPIYTFTTVFGYFKREALANQVGLPVSAEQRAAFELPCEAPIVDLTARPADFFGPGARLAEPMLLMVDRVTGRWPTGGGAGLGEWRGVKDVNPADWYFKAHFFQDPVQPGSLGIEMMLQLLQFAMLDLGLGKEAGAAARFEPVALHDAMTWRYRGQIIPTNKQIAVQVEITRIVREDAGILAVAEANLWVDGKRIYSASNLGMRITRDASPSQTALDAGTAATAPAAGPSTPSTAAVTAGSAITMETTLDPAQDTWITDHCPTYVIPSLPMMSVMDLFAQAATEAAGGAKVVEVTDVQMVRWVVVDSPKQLRVVLEPTEPGRYSGRLEVWRDAPRAALSRWEIHAHAVVVTAAAYGGAPEIPAPLDGAVPYANPYDGTVFHGPAFATLMDGARIGRNGSSGTLSIERCGVPVGALHPGILDGALHVVPHTAMSVWTTDTVDVASYADAADPTVGFPRRVVWARFYGDTPVEGTVDVEARFVGFDDDEGRMPTFDLWLSVAGTPWACIRLAEFLLPKGPLAEVGGPERRAFMADRRPVPGLSLSDRLAPGVVALDPVRAATLDWFKGTLQEVYDTDSQGSALIVDIATKEAVADAAKNAIHPSQVRIVDGQVSCPSLPLERISVGVEHTPDGGCRATASLHTDWTPVRDWWADTNGMTHGGFGELALGALMLRYVRHVVVTDPEAMAAVYGRPVLLLANHQVQVESILGTTIAMWLTGTKVVTIGHAKHDTRWVGELLRSIDASVGRELGHLRYFDQRQPHQFFGLVDAMRGEAAEHGVSTMVHADGTRAVSSRQRVERLTSTLLDMAIEVPMPIVPVYFAGGLPEESMDDKLEVPYRHAAQDYIFGRPIMPDELNALPYANRRRYVMDSINALAPFSDAPHEPNVQAENRIAAAAPGASPLEGIWECVEDAMNGLPVDWRNAVGTAEWLASRSAQRPSAPSSLR